VVQIFSDNSLFIGEGTIIEDNTSIKSIGFSSLINISKFCHFRSYSSIRAWEAGRVVISESVFLNNFCSINCYNRIEIGKNTLLGEGVKIYDHNHNYSFEPDLFVNRNEFSTSPVIIGNNCWIGSNVTILKAVTIGDNVIIGANCLIYKSIPSNSIVKHKEDLIIETRDSNV
jgi:acetyltransferase-like isoleucine patch superfamily enzyme